MPGRRRRPNHDMPGAPKRVRPDYGGAVTKPSERRRWRRQMRPELLRSTLDATNTLRWSPLLLEVLTEEMYVGDSLEELLGTPLRSLDEARYPQAVALALVLRHSWQPDDLKYVLERLGLAPPSPSEE